MYWAKRLTVLICLTTGLLLMVICAGCGGGNSALGRVGGTGGGLVVTVGPLAGIDSAALADHAAAAVSGAFFLHGTGPNSNPPVLYLDRMEPAADTPKFKDSSGIAFRDGNPWEEVGVWPAAAELTGGSLIGLDRVQVWLGLKNSDDQGTNFDLRAEVLRNGELVVAGETYLITGLTRNAAKAKEVLVEFPGFASVEFDGAVDELSLRVLTRIGTDGEGNFGGGHANATGLRLYFDGVSRASRFGATLNVGPQAVAGGEPLSGDSPLEVSFSAAGSYDPDGVLVRYEWDFGEGDGFEDFTATEGAAAHVYASAGDFSAVLRVTDDSGAEDTDGVDVAVTEPGWFHTWGGSYMENPKCVVADAAGNVYVAGNTGSYSTRWYDVLLLCYDSAGDLQWARTWGGSGDDTAVCMVLGPNGHLYLAGASNSSFTTVGTDLLLLEYLTSGDLVAARLWCGPYQESACGVAVDDMGVYVAGQRSTSTPTNLSYSGLLLRFDDDWTPTMEYAIVSQPVNYGIYGFGILADGAGSLYLCGHTYKGGGIHDSGVAWVMRCSTSGVFDWGRMWYGPGYDKAASMCLDGETLYVGGHTGSFGIGGYDSFLLSMTTGGALNWQRTLGTTDSDYHLSNGLVPMVADGRLYGAMTFGPTTGAKRLVLSEWDPPTGNLLSHLERQQDDGQMTYNTGLANLCAMPDGALVVTGNAVNAPGTWQPGSGAALACNASFENWSPSFYEISGTMRSPVGVVSAPTGVADTGGGLEDFGIGKYVMP